MSGNYENSLLVFDATQTLPTATITGVYHIPKYGYEKPADEEETKFIGLYQNLAVRFIGETEAINLEHRHARSEQRERIERCLNLEYELGIKVGPGKDKRYKKNELLFYLAEEISPGEYFYPTNCGKNSFLSWHKPYEHLPHAYTGEQPSAKELAEFLRGKHL